MKSILADPAKAMWIVETLGPNGKKGAVGYALAGPCGLPHAEVTPDCGELKRIYFLREAQGGGHAVHRGLELHEQRAAGAGGPAGGEGRCHGGGSGSGGGGRESGAAGGRAHTNRSKM